MIETIALEKRGYRCKASWMMMMIRHLSEASQEWADADNDDEALRCIRADGHDGLCRSKAERGAGTITYSEWQSKNGKFHSHHAYHTIYPANGAAP